MYYVYILQSEKDKKFYLGYTSNLRLRYQEHNGGRVQSTHHRRPLKLVYYEAYIEKCLAVKRETHLKRFGSAYMGLMRRLGHI